MPAWPSGLVPWTPTLALLCGAALGSCSVCWDSSATYFMRPDATTACLTGSCLPPMLQLCTSVHALRGVGAVSSPIITLSLWLSGMFPIPGSLSSSAIFLQNSWQMGCISRGQGMFQLMPCHTPLSVTLSLWVSICMNSSGSSRPQMTSVQHRSKDTSKSVLPWQSSAIELFCKVAPLHLGGPYSVRWVAACPAPYFVLTMPRDDVLVLIFHGSTSALPMLGTTDPYELWRRTAISAIS